MNKKYLAYLVMPLLAATIGGAVLVSSVSADTTTSGQNPMTNLVNKIAEKFNLNPSDVQQVFDDQRAQMQDQMNQKYQDRISQAISDGKLTQEQADKIIAKKTELESERQDFKADLEGKTKEEMRDAMKTQMDSLKQWASDNNISMEYLMFGRPMMHRGFGFGSPR